MSGRKPKRRANQSGKPGASGPARGSGRSSKDRRGSGRSRPPSSDGDRRPSSDDPPKRRRRTPRGLGGDQVEGRQAVRELLLAGNRRVGEVLMIEDLGGADVLADIEELTRELNVTFRPVSRKRMTAEALTDSHQGVIARAAPLAEADLDELINDPRAFLLVLDGITDPGNLGAILRTAECAGVTGVILGRHRSVHITPTVTKTAAGAVEHVPLVLVGGIPTAVAQLNEAGIFTVGLDSAGEQSIFELPPAASGPIALVLGAEGPGLSRLVRDRVGVTASIPLGGRLNSLNVAMASAVACFEIVRSRSS